MRIAVMRRTKTDKFVGDSCDHRDITSEMRRSTMGGLPNSAKTKMDSSTMISKKPVPQRGCVSEKRCTDCGVSSASAS